MLKSISGFICGFDRDKFIHCMSLIIYRIFFISKVLLQGRVNKISKVLDKYLVKYSMSKFFGVLRSFESFFVVNFLG